MGPALHFLTAAERNSRGGANNRLAGSLTIAAVLCWAAPCVAQTSAELAAFKDINQRVPAPAVEAIRADALNAVQDEMRRRGVGCVATGIEIGPLSPLTADRNVFLAIGEGVLANAFVASVVQQGCGDDAPPVVLHLFGYPSGEWQARFGVIGRTIAWFSLIRDAQEAITTSAHLKLYGLVPDCRDSLRMELVELGDTRKAGAEIYGVRYQGRWSETWRFSACGYDLAVPVRFKADGKGGARFSISAGDVVATKRPGPTS